jgi:hypothetical protein
LLIYPYLPQFAWLEGSVLIVEDKWGAVGKCDLTSAAKIALHAAPIPGWSWSFCVLHARQGPHISPIHLVLTGPDWFLLSAEHLRMLADIISSRPAVRPIHELGGDRLPMCCGSEGSRPGGSRRWARSRPAGVIY